MQATVSASVEAGTAGILDGDVPLRFAHWQGSSARGTVILVTGRGEFIEVYAEAIADFRERGYAVLAYDHRGQGGSARVVPYGGHVRAFADYAGDLETMVRVAAQAGLPRPYHIVAHSMGGLVALLAAPRIATEVERMVLLAPMLEIASLPARAGLVAKAAGALCLVGQARRPLSRHRPPTPFPQNRLTSDPRRYAAMCAVCEAEPGLVVGPPTVGWLAAAFRAMRRVWREEGEFLPVPTLFVASGADTIVSTAAIDRFARAAIGGGLVTVPGARHHVLLERDSVRRLALAAIDAFLADAPTRLTDTRASNFARPLKLTPIPPIPVPVRARPDGAAAAAAAAGTLRRSWRAPFSRRAEMAGDVAPAPPLPGPDASAAPLAAPSPAPVAPASKAPTSPSLPVERSRPPRRGWRKPRAAPDAIGEAAAAVVVDSPVPPPADPPVAPRPTAAKPGFLRRRAGDAGAGDADAGSEKLRQRLRRRRERRVDDPSGAPAAVAAPTAAAPATVGAPASAAASVPAPRAAPEADAGRVDPTARPVEPAAATAHRGADAHHVERPPHAVPDPAPARPAADPVEPGARLSHTPRRGAEMEASRGLLAAPPQPSPSRRPRRTFRR